MNQDDLWPHTPQNEGDPVPKQFRGEGPIKGDVTPEMIAAGVAAFHLEVLNMWNDGPAVEENVVLAIYRAMVESR